MKYNDNGTDPIPSNIFLDISLVELFNARLSFHFLTPKLRERSDPVFVTDNPFYGSVADKDGAAHLEYLKMSENNKVDLRYKTLLYIYEPTRDTRSYLVFSEAWLKTDELKPFGFSFSRHGSTSYFMAVTEETIENAMDSSKFFPICFNVDVDVPGRDRLFSAISLREKPFATNRDTACNRIEIYEVRYVHDMIYPPELNSNHEYPVKDDLKPNDDSIDDFHQTRLAYKREMELLQMKVQNFDHEVKFMARYFFNRWRNGEMPESPEEGLAAVVEEKKKH
jgi:hypothetical protein